MINLHNLHAFISVAEQGSVRKAAERLHRAFSAVARSVTALEQALDVPLFERKQRGMLLTGAGGVVHLRALRIRQELLAVQQDASLPLTRGVANGVGCGDALFNETRLTAATMLADVRHMPTVARALGVSQPAVSQMVTRLEQALGQRMFVRTARGMVPTDAGRRWTVQFGRVLAEMRHIEADVAALGGVLRGRVSVGALPLARTLLLPAAITRMLEQHPGLQVRSLESTYEQLCAGLVNGSVDFILGALRPHTRPDLATEVLFSDKNVLIARAGHPLAMKPAVSIEDLLPFPWVLSRAGTPLRDSLDEFFADHGRAPPQPVVETGDLALVRGLLLQSDLITVLPAQQLHYELAAGSLTVLPIEMHGMQRDIGFVTRAGAQLAPGALTLMAALRAVIQEHHQPRKTDQFVQPPLARSVSSYGATLARAAHYC